MDELTRSQKDHKNCQEQNNCSTCRFAEQRAVKEYRACCTYGSKLKFTTDNACLTHEDR